MEITTTLDPGDRASWRAWLAGNGTSASEIWLLLRRDAPGALTYLDAVEEALCVGWIDGITKRHDGVQAIRFTPRRPRSNWTELNKERCRRLIRWGLMTDAGLRVAPDLTEREPEVADDVRAAFTDANAWAWFAGQPRLYRAVKLSNLESMRRVAPEQFAKGLANLVSASARGRHLGQWDDSTLPHTRGFDADHDRGAHRG